MFSLQVATIAKKKQIHQLLDTFPNSLNDLKTQHLRRKNLEEKSLYIPPRKILIDDGGKLYDASSIGQYIPIKLLLKKFLEKTENLEKLQTFMSGLENDVPRMLRHFFQGFQWKKMKTKFPDKYLIPLFLYFDDFSIGNTLGLHSLSNKIGAVYYTIPTSASQVSNSFDNIFTALLFKSNDGGEFGDVAVFDTLLTDLKNIEK